MSMGPNGLIYPGGDDGPGWSEEDQNPNDQNPSADFKKPNPATSEDLGENFLVVTAMIAGPIFWSWFFWKLKTWGVVNVFCFYTNTNPQAYSGPLSPNQEAAQVVTVIFFLLLPAICVLITSVITTLIGLVIFHKIRGS